MTQKAPAEDTSLVDVAAQLALTQYALHGGFPPLGFIQLAGGETLIVPAESASDENAKRQFVNILRYMSIEHGGQRSAVVMETWTLIGDDPDDHRILKEIYARGGSMSEHPNAGEAIYVMLESDAGTTVRMHRIVRDGKAVTLEPQEEQFQPAATRRQGGIFSAFHIPTVRQRDAGAEAFAAVMRHMCTDVSYERIVPKEGPRAN